MIKSGKNVNEVRRAIGNLHGKVDVTVALGRNKCLHFRGELSGVYPALFTVRPDDEHFLGKTSYSYAEVLCGSVKLSPVKEKRA